MTAEIRLLGSVSVRGRDGTDHPLVSHHARVVLARLALERPDGVTRDQFADALWSTDLPATWPSAVRNTVSRVRAFLAEALATDSDVVTSENGRYRLCLPDDTVIDLEVASGAVAAARSALAAGSYVDASRLAKQAAASLTKVFLLEHDSHWVCRVRDQLSLLAVANLETASSAAAAVDDPVEALRFADEAIALAPLRESAHRCRLSAHAAAGNRGEALAAYQNLRRVLAEELGVDPAPETEAAYLSLLGSAESGRSAQGGRPAPGPSGRLPFVGRHDELEILWESWQRAAHGTPQVVLVAGEPGCGKTRLVAEAASRVADDGGMVLQGRSEQWPPPPYAPLIEALTGYVAATPPDALPHLDTLPALDVTTMLELAVTPAAGERPAGPPPDPARVARMLTELTSKAAGERPLLLVLDDLHRADTDTLRWLLHVVPRLDGTRLLAVATTGDGAGLTADHRALVNAADGDGGLRRIRLPGLGIEEIHALVDQLMPGEAPARRRLAARGIVVDTGGNPLLVSAVLNHGGLDDPGSSDDVPPQVGDWVEARLAALEAPSRELLGAAVVAGRTFEVDLVAHSAGLDSGAALDAIDDLLAAGLLVETATPDGQPTLRLRFAQDLVRRAVASRLSGARRRRLHAGLAEAIETYRDHSTEPYLHDLTHHRLNAADLRNHRTVVTWSRRAAAHARRRRAAPEAIQLYHQALEHVSSADPALRADILTDAGLAQLEAGDGDSAQTLLDAAIHARRCGRVDIACRAVLGLVDASRRTNQLQHETAALVRSLLGSPGTSIDPLDRGRLMARHIELGGRLANGSLTGVADSVAALRHRLGEVTGPETLGQRFDLARALELVAGAAEDLPGQITAAHHRAMVAASFGDHATVQEVLPEMMRGAGRDHPATVTMIADHSVAMAVTQGRFTDAAAAAALVESVATDGPPALEVEGPRSLAARQLLVGWWLEGGRQWTVADGGSAEGTTTFLADHALRALARGDRGEAHLTVRALATGVEDMPVGDEWLHTAGVLGLVAVELGDPATAGALLALLAPYADLTCGVGYRSFLGPMRFHLGRLAMLTGDWASAERHLTSVLNSLTARRARPWLALTQTALADALEARGRSCDRDWGLVLRSEAKRNAVLPGLPPLTA